MPDPQPRFLLVLAWVLACAWPSGLSRVAAQEPPAKPKPAASSTSSKGAGKAGSKTPASADAAATSATSGLSAFGSQIPAQQPNKGVVIPSFSDGKRSSLVEADVVTRIDDNRLLAEKMIIHLFGQTPAENVTVTLPSATFSMDQQILRSSERSKVSRADFDLEGDALIFDTTTSQGRMSGNVRMTIHDAGAFAKNVQVPAGEAKADPSTPGPAPAKTSPSPASSTPPSATAKP